MKKTFITVVLLSVCFSLLAQNPKRVRIMSGQVQDSTSMAELFYGFDFSDVPTGYLVDAGLSPLELSRFEAGAENVPAVTFPILYSIVESMKEMDVSSVRQWQYALESIFRTLDDGEIGIFVIEMVNADGGYPVQSFHIPVLRKDDLNL